MNTSSSHYSEQAPSPDEVAASEGVLILNFGTDWCGHCQAAAPVIAAGLAQHPDVPHIKVEDGSGRPLGRSFRVKLWPTLIFLKDGKEVARLVRPSDEAAVHEALEQTATG